MRNRFFNFFLILFVLSFSNSLAQIQKASFQLGISTAALFELNSNGLNGLLLNLHGEYAFTDRFIGGIQPYYAFTDEKNTYAYDLILLEPRSIRKDVFNSFGINAELKFIMCNTPKLKLYSSVIFGAGYCSYHVYQTNVFGKLASQDLGHFVNYNLGIGMGAYIPVSENCYIDTKIMYTDVTASKDIDASRYIYPSIGLIKSF